MSTSHPRHQMVQRIDNGSKIFTDRAAGLGITKIGDGSATENECSPKFVEIDMLSEIWCKNLWYLHVYACSLHTILPDVKLIWKKIFWYFCNCWSWLNSHNTWIWCCQTPESKLTKICEMWLVMNRWYSTYCSQIHHFHRCSHCLHHKPSYLECILQQWSTWTQR